MKDGETGFEVLLGTRELRTFWVGARRSSHRPASPQPFLPCRRTWVHLQAQRHAITDAAGAQDCAEAARHSPRPVPREHAPQLTGYRNKQGEEGAACPSSHLGLDTLGLLCDCE